MNVLVDPGSFDCANAGAVSTLVVALRRLTAHFPGARLLVFCDAPKALARQCPDAVPVPHLLGREAWRRGGFLLGRAEGRLPAVVRDAWERGATRARGRWPVVYRQAVARRLSAIGEPSDGAAAYLAALAEADLYVIAGQGSLADEARVQAEAVLDTCDRMRARGVPVVFLAQGIGPLRHAALRARIAHAVSHAAFVSLRERATATSLLVGAGVPDYALHVTGDDAIELAHRWHPAALGTGLGLNVRRAPLAVVDPEDRERLRDVVHRLGATLGVPIVPLPISRHRAGTNDAITIGALLEGYPAVDREALAAETPLEVIAAAARCRVVLTGAYHAAVFALSQGVAAVCVGTSDYYLHKFDGLCEQFGPGCSVVRAGGADLEARVEAAVHEAWHHADALRPRLLAAAARQVALADEAYEEMAMRVGRIHAAAGRAP